MNYLSNLKELININSHTKNKTGVDKVGQLMSNWLKELNYKFDVYEREDIGNHLHFKSSYNKNKKRILLLGHNDTVFPKDSFEEYHQDDRWIYGPGACDMKGGNIVALQSLRNIYKKNKNIENIDFLLVSDEETGSDDSKTLTKKLAKNYDICFVFEAAGANLEVVTQRKGVGTYKIMIQGLAAHAGNNYENGSDANLEASYKLQEIVKLTNLKEETTVNVGKIQGGIGANTISPYCELLLEFRFSKKSEKERILNSLKKIVNCVYVKGVKSSMIGSIQRDVMEENQEQLNLIKKIEDITCTKIFTEHRGGVSDANIVSNCGVITIDGFGPYGQGDHTINEKALISSFEQRIELMTTILNHFQIQDKDNN